jgi:hypothetical protein
MKKIRCFLGLHDYSHTPVIAYLGTHWQQGGRTCKHCNKYACSLEEAQIIAKSAYRIGKYHQYATKGNTAP